jgi:hypothetical protein
MKNSSSQIRNAKRAIQGPARRGITGTNRRRTRYQTETKGKVTVEPEARAGQVENAAPHPLAELLECPPETGTLLNSSSGCIDVDAGEVVFRQGEVCRGLYVVVSGLFVRRAERMETRLALGPARPGDLVELGAALGEGLHTFTLSAQTPGSLLQLPIDALHQAFESFPPLRMQLLEELAREVSRCYYSCCLNRMGSARRRNGDVPTQ